MGYEPRMRGTRFRRSTSKKQSSRDKGEEPEASVFYQERAPAVPSEVSTRVLNAIVHLGTQRFALPPFAEHFERWIRDVRAILAEFEDDLPGVADQPYRETVAKVLSNVQEGFRKLKDGEKSFSEEILKLQQELTSCEREISDLERARRIRINEAKKGHERSLSKIKGEIDALDQQRLTLLRKRPSIVERLLGQSGAKLEESKSARESKLVVLDGKEKTLENELRKLKRDFEMEKKQLVARRESLMTKLTETRGNLPDDALAMRREACEELSRVVNEAVNRLLSRPLASTPGNSQ